MTERNDETTEQNDGMIKKYSISIWYAPTNSRHCVNDPSFLHSQWKTKTLVKMVSKEQCKSDKLRGHSPVLPIAVHCSNH